MSENPTGWGEPINISITGGYPCMIVPMIDQTEANLANLEQTQKIETIAAKQTLLEQKTSLYFYMAASITSSLLAQRKQTTGVLAMEAMLSIALTTASIYRMTTEAFAALALPGGVGAGKGLLLLTLAGVLTMNLVKQQITRVQANQLRDYTNQIKTMKEAHGI